MFSKTYCLLAVGSVVPVFCRWIALGGALEVAPRIQFCVEARLAQNHGYTRGWGWGVGAHIYIYIYI